MSKNCIWPIYRILSGATKLDISGPWSDGNEGLLRIPQSSSITGASSSDYLVSYISCIRWGWFYTPTEMQSVYSTVPVVWVIEDQSKIKQNRFFS